MTTPTPTPSAEQRARELYDRISNSILRSDMSGHKCIAELTAIIAERDDVILAISGKAGYEPVTNSGKCAKTVLAERDSYRAKALKWDELNTLIITDAHSTGNDAPIDMPDQVIKTLSACHQHARELEVRLAKLQPVAKRLADRLSHTTALLEHEAGRVTETSMLNECAVTDYKNLAATTRGDDK
jgi:hypothetical protein